MDNAYHSKMRQIASRNGTQNRPKASRSTVRVKAVEAPAFGPLLFAVGFASLVALALVSLAAQTF